MDQDLSSILKNGVLRAAINTGNRALVQAEGDNLRGVSPALARRLAERLSARLEPVIYDGAGKVFADADKDLWDIGFLAIDATRAKVLSFTRPYHVIEATYATRAHGSIKDVDEADQDGVRILTSSGSAYDMYLTANLAHAHLHHSGTPADSFEEFRAGGYDLVAEVRATLERYFRDDDGYRVLPGCLTSVKQAMVLPGRDNPMIGTLDAFVEEAMNDGFVARELGTSS